MKELFVIVAREPEATPLPVFETREKRVGERARELEILAAKPHLHHLDDRRQQVSVVVEIGIERRETVASRRVKASVAPCGCRQRIERGDREIGPARLVLRARCAREPRDRQSIPCRQHLVITARMNAFLARRKERCFDARQSCLRIQSTR